MRFPPTLRRRHHFVDRTASASKATLTFATGVTRLFSQEDAVESKFRSLRGVMCTYRNHYICLHTHYCLLYRSIITVLVLYKHVRLPLFDTQPSPCLSIKASTHHRTTAPSFPSFHLHDFFHPPSFHPQPFMMRTTSSSYTRPCTVCRHLFFLRAF